MARDAVRLLDSPDRVRLALTPLRRQLLDRLREPASATELAAVLGLPRQRVNYHVRALEAAGLVELVELRQRRGCTERIVRAAADAFVVDPQVLGSPATTSKVVERDRFAAEHLVGVAAATVRDVGRMASTATGAGKRLLTFTVETELRFASPADVHRFTDELAEAIARLAAGHAVGTGGRRYRVVVGGHPTPSRPTPKGQAS